MYMYVDLIGNQIIISIFCFLSLSHCLLQYVIIYMLIFLFIGTDRIAMSERPSNFILLIVPRRYFCCGSNCFVFWKRIFVLFEPYVRFHILVQFG